MSRGSPESHTTAAWCSWGGTGRPWGSWWAARNAISPLLLPYTVSPLPVYFLLGGSAPLSLLPDSVLLGTLKSEPPYLRAPAWLRYTAEAGLA